MQSLLHGRVPHPARFFLRRVGDEGASKPTKSRIVSRSQPKQGNAKGDESVKRAEYQMPMAECFFMSAPARIRSAQTAFRSAPGAFKLAQTLFKSAQIDLKSAQKTITPMFSTNLFKCAELKSRNYSVAGCSGL